MRSANEMLLQSNSFSHWLGANLEAALQYTSAQGYTELNLKGLHFVSTPQGLSTQHEADLSA